MTCNYRYVGGQTTWDAVLAGTAGGDLDGDGIDDPWHLVQTRDEFRQLMSGPTPARVLGVPKVATTLQQSRGGDTMADPFVVPSNQNVPNLAEMTAAALNVLDNDPDGLFLMVEGGAIDWASHGNQKGRTIEEQIDFNAAVQTVLDWVSNNSNWGETLVIVTGDHETGYLTGPGSNPDWEPLLNNGEGVLPGMQFNSGDHTNSLIPLFAKGDAARGLKQLADEEDPVRGPYVDNAELGQLVLAVME
jgi:alkaline phosphatase